MKLFFSYQIKHISHGSTPIHKKDRNKRTRYKTAHPRHTIHLNRYASHISTHATSSDANSRFPSSSSATVHPPTSSSTSQQPKDPAAEAANDPAQSFAWHVNTLPPQHSIHAAISLLHRHITTLAAQYKTTPSGLMRIEIPIPRTYTALRWLQAQKITDFGNDSCNSSSLVYPQVYFSPRRSSAPETPGSTRARAASMGIGSVAGAGAAWVWQGMPKEMLSEVTMDSMKRFLGHNGNSSWSNSRSENERHKVRIFGGNRFDQGSIPAPEWEEFGSFYFFLPRLEYREMSGGNLLACTIAWDTTTDSLTVQHMRGGYSSLEAAIADCTAALSVVQLPAGDQPRGVFQVQNMKEKRHLPDEDDWKDGLESIHAELQPITAIQKDIKRRVSKRNTNSINKVNPEEALDEYIRNGQQGLDGLLAALDSGWDLKDSDDDDALASENSNTIPSGTSTSSKTRSSNDSGTSTCIDGRNSPQEVSSGATPTATTKVVLARRTDLHLGGTVDPLSLLEALQERDPRAYQFMLALPSGVTFLGSTPECLYTRTGRAIASEAVAGTRGRGPGGDIEKDFWLAFDLLQSEKDDVEFGVVRDWVERTLNTLCEDGVDVEVAKSVLKQGAVQHLYSKLAGTLRKSVDDTDILRALHPTPAVCGQPRRGALRMLSDAEPFDRGMYAGPFGWIAHDASEFVVAIRSALIQSKFDVKDSTADEAAQYSNTSQMTTSPPYTKVSLYAGVGIVYGSDTSSEWAELNLKINQYERLLRDAPSFRCSPNINSAWARLMVEELCRLGCNTFCVAPGSRSSPLTVAVAQHPRAKIVPCIDERSLGFWAMGYGRATGRPAIVITSSGTAVANLLPSVVEASQSNIPMVVLTADRPAWLRETGANQTIDQVEIFGGYVRWEMDVPTPSDGIPAESLLRLIDDAVATAQQTPAGPVHVNCQFEEPLEPVETSWDGRCLDGIKGWIESGQPYHRVECGIGYESYAGARTGCSHQRGDAIDENIRTGNDEPSVIDTAKALSIINSAQKGLIVLGELIHPEDIVAAIELAKHLKWPVVADVLSGVKIHGKNSGGSNSNSVSADHCSHTIRASDTQGLALCCHFDHIVLCRDRWNIIQPDVILQFGGHLTSKRSMQFMEWCAGGAGNNLPRTECTSWVFVDRSPRKEDQGKLVSCRVKSTVAEFLLVLQKESFPSNKKDGQDPSSTTLAQHKFKQLLLALDKETSAAVDRALSRFPELTEPQVARLLSQVLPPGEGLFIGNSMPIRDLDMYGVSPPSIHYHQTDSTQPSDALAADAFSVNKNKEESSSALQFNNNNNNNNNNNGAVERTSSNISSIIDTGIGAPIAANRGASGIDGVLSTAAGFADGLGNGCTLVVGDVSFLHDINGLNLLRSGELRPPLTVLLINNNGGGIFSFLPIADSVPEDVFTPLWATPQNVDLAGLCRAHGLPHLKVYSIDELKQALTSAWNFNRHSVIEVITDRKSNVARHREIQAEVMAALQGVFEESLGRENDSCIGSNTNGSSSPCQGRSKGVICEASFEEYSMQLTRPLATRKAFTATQSYTRGSGELHRDENQYRTGYYFTLRVKSNLQTDDAASYVAMGEASPLDGLHRESMADVAAQLAYVSATINSNGSSGSETNGTRRVMPSTIDDIDHWIRHDLGLDSDSLFPSVRCAIEGALLSALSLLNGGTEENASRSVVSPAVFLSPTRSTSTSWNDAKGAKVPMNALIDSPSPGQHRIQHAVRDALNATVVKGYRCLKIKVGRQSDPEDDARMVVAIRDAVGENVVLRADANRAWTLDQAVRFGTAVAHAGLEYVEEPLYAANTQDIELFFKETGVAVALDESIDQGIFLVDQQEYSLIDGDTQHHGEMGKKGCTEREALCPNERYLKLPYGVVAVILKPSVLGGFIACLKLARQARAQGAIAVVSSSFESPLGLQQLCQLASVINNPSAGAVDAENAPGNGKPNVVYHGLATHEWFVSLSSEDSQQGGASREDTAKDMPIAQNKTTHYNNFITETMVPVSVNPSRSATSLAADGFHDKGCAVDPGADDVVSWHVVSTSTATPSSSSSQQIVFLHGFLGSADEWIPFMHAVHAVHQPSIAVDLPGHRHTTSLKSIFSLEHMADALIALLSSMKVENSGARFILVGYSLGARLAYLVASKRPDLIAQVMSIGGAPGMDGERAQRMQRAAADTALARSLRESPSLHDFLVTCWYNTPFWSTLRAHPRFESIIERRVFENSGRKDDISQVLEQASPGNSPENTMHRLANSNDTVSDKNMPKFVCIAGEKDFKYVEIGKKVEKELHPSAMAVIVSGSGHAVHIEKPLKTLELLLQHLHTDK